MTSFRNFATSRIQLREFTSSDVSLLIDLDSDPDVMRFLTGGSSPSKEEEENAMQRILALTEKHQGKFGTWVATEKESGLYMGWFIFRPHKKDPENVKRIELGYRLKKAFWGKGYATEMSKALIKVGFEERGIDEVFAVAMKANLGSQNVMKKCGLTFHRQFISGEFPHSKELDVEYVLTKQQYLALENS